MPSSVSLRELRKAIDDWGLETPPIAVNGDTARAVPGRRARGEPAVTLEDRIRPLLELLYPGHGTDVTAQVLELLARHRPALAARAVHPPLTERTAYLIIYGDTVRRPGQPPLQTPLAELLRDHVGDAVSDVHLLPIFPWTSDDGFAVVDHRQVDPALGTWDDVTALTPTQGVMLDFVANHVSASSPWFRDWLADDPRRDGFFTPRASARAASPSMLALPRFPEAALRLTRPDRRHSSGAG